MRDQYSNNDKHNQQFWQGYVLVSRFDLADPNFRETVIFLVDHNTEGAFGFVVNRALDLSINEILPQLTGVRAIQDRVYMGGPVQREYIMALHNGNGLTTGTEIIPGVFFEPVFENLFPVFMNGDNDAKILTFSGYSGWGPGQLETEIDMETWIVLPCDKELIFSENPKQSWREALKAKGGIFRVFAETTLDPDLN